MDVHNFWDLDATNSGSWIWKSLCKLRSLARPFVICEVGSGQTASFWKDNWTSLGPLIALTGAEGPRVTGIAEDAVVTDAIVQGEWRISTMRSRHPIISLLRQCLPSSNPIANAHEDDLYSWKIGNTAPVRKMSVAKTWLSLQNPLPPVFWHKSVWFKDRIPKHSFVTWVVAWDRLPTRDRLRRWGLNVPSTCLLCNSSEESRQHLFFDCPFSSQVWSFFSSKAHLVPPSAFEDGIRWIKDPTRDKNVALIMKLSYQASIYLLWKERNSRLHSGVPRPVSAIIADIQTIIRARIAPLSLTQGDRHVSHTYLCTWFDLFQA